MLSNLIGDDRPALDERLESIRTKVIDLTALQGVFMAPAFRSIYHNPDRDLAEALAWLYGPSVDRNLEAAILILAMQRLPSEKYASLLEATLAAFESKKIPERVLGLALFPGYEWEPPTVFFYEDQKMAAALAKVAQSAYVSEALRSGLSSIISGAMKEEYNKLKNIGYVRKLPDEAAPPQDSQNR